MEVLKIDEWISVNQDTQFVPLYMYGTLVSALRKSDGKEFEVDQLVYNYLDNNVEKICGFCQDFIHVELETMKVPINQINPAKRLEVAAYTLLQSLRKNVGKK
jgi:hypothetical protein